MKAVSSNQLLRVLVRDGLWRSESLSTAGMMLAQVDLVLQVGPTSCMVLTCKRLETFFQCS